MNSKSIVVILFSTLLASCNQEETGGFDVINKDSDGRISIINQGSGKLIVINKSNRIDDVIDLNLKDEEIAKIKNAKEKQDAALKIKNWGETSITGTKYKVALSTRHYKDKLLYTFYFMPSDGTTASKARSTTINLRDANGFALEKINPSLSWATVVDDNGKPQYEQASGEVPMTLDNYLEISAYDPGWSFR